MTPQKLRDGARFVIIAFPVLLAAFAIAPLAAEGLGTTTQNVYIVVDDNQREKFIDVRKGFTETLDAQLARVGAKAAYTVLETKSDKALVPSIIKAIQDGRPDLVAVINSSAVFADINITSKHTGSTRTSTATMSAAKIDTPPMNILITGATGNIGAELIRTLLGQRPDCSSGNSITTIR